MRLYYLPFFLLLLFCFCACGGRKLLGEETLTNPYTSDYVLKNYEGGYCELYHVDTLFLSGEYANVSILCDTVLFKAIVAERPNGLIELYDTDGALLIDTTANICAIERIVDSDLPDTEVYYEVRGQDGSKGIYRSGYGMIIPAQYSYINSFGYDVDWDRVNDRNSGFFSWFEVRRNDSIAAISMEGRIIVPQGDWSSIGPWWAQYELPMESNPRWLQEHGDLFHMMGMVVRTNRDTQGLYSLDGVEIIPPKYQRFYAVYKYKPHEANYFKAENQMSSIALYDKKGHEIVPLGKYAEVVVNGEETYSKIKCIVVSPDGDEIHGVLDMEGNEIVPLLRVGDIDGRDGRLQALPLRKSGQDIEEWLRYSWEDITPAFIAKHRVNSHTGDINNASVTVSSARAVVPQQQGGTRQVWKPCWDCNGSGECRYCHGKGWDYVTNGRGEIISSQKCIVCNGTGRCQSCAGSRGHYETEFF